MRRPTNITPRPPKALLGDAYTGLMIVLDEINYLVFLKLNYDALNNAIRIIQPLNRTIDVQDRSAIYM